MIRDETQDATSSNALGRRALPPASFRRPLFPLARWLAGLALLSASPLAAAPADSVPPTVPTLLAASCVQATGFTVSWRASSDNVRVTGYELTLDGKGRGTGDELVRHLTGLDPETEHVVTVRARDAKGNWSAPSAPLRVTTPGDTTPPTVPGQVAAENVTLQGFTLTWAASADDVKTTAYDVAIDGVSVGQAASRRRLVKELSPGHGYVVTVRAGDAAGNWSAPSEPLTVRTLADTTPPTAPENLRTPAIAATRFLLKWTPSHDDVKVVEYEVLRDGHSLGRAKGTSRRVTDLAPRTSYTMVVRAYDAAGNFAESGPLVVCTAADTRKPRAPAGLTANALTASSLTLSWTVPRDNVGVTAFEVFQGGVAIGTTSAPSLAVTGLAPGMSYVFTVRARDAAGNVSGKSAVLHVTTPEAPACAAPSVPAGLAVGEVSPTGFRLDWQVSTGGTGTISYQVTLDGAVLGTTAAPTFVVAGLSAGSVHRVQVRAMGADGSASELSEALVITLPEPSAVEGFEVADGLRTGPLAGQGTWQSGGAADVVRSPVYAGAQSLAVAALADSGFARRTFATPLVGIVFADLYARPVAAASPELGRFLDVGGAGVALVGSGAAAELWAFDGGVDGAGAWVPTGREIALENGTSSAAWLRLTLRLDRATGRWDLSLDGALVVSDLGLAGPPAPESGVVVSLSGGAVMPSYFDEVLVATENPMFPDADRDGMADAWESAHGLDPARDDRTADADADGVSNIDEWAIGANPAQSDSDGDGMPDGWELAQGLNPLAAGDGALDTDGDGRSNREEFLGGSNPLDYYNGRAFVVEAGDVAGSGTRYGYDLSGRLTSAAFAGGTQLRYEHDAASNLVRVTASGSPPIVTWRAAHGLPADGSGVGADTAVVAGDGLPNFAKYALGLDPWTSAVGEFPAVSRTAMGRRSFLTLTYQHPDPLPADLRLTVEVSAEGATWSSGPMAVTTLSESVQGGIRTVRVRDLAPSDGASPARRIRLKIQKQLSL